MTFGRRPPSASCIMSKTTRRHLDAVELTQPAIDRDELLAEIERLRALEARLGRPATAHEISG